ncbi:MAG: ArnT family glycosyltransferase [Crocinitomicaceae bacterium]
MRFWDESIFAVNTFEMMENRQYFPSFYDGQPDLYNTKPPLLNWLQIIASHIFGYNELSMRLPWAIGAGLSVLAIFNFLKKYFGHT